MSMTAAFSSPSGFAPRIQSFYTQHSLISVQQFTHSSGTHSLPSLSLSFGSNPIPRTKQFVFLTFSALNDGVNASANLVYDEGGDGNDGNNFSGSGGGGADDGKGDAGDASNNSNKKEAMMALAEAGRSMESLPKDLRAAIEDGRIPGSIILKYFELEKTPLFAWLMRFGGFKERLLADDLFLAKVFMECGVGMFTKTAAEYERRRENFFNELEIVFADVVMAIIADFMLVYLPAPTVSLRAPIGVNAGRLAKFFHNCPDNAFQVALAGTSYSLLQRIGAIVVGTVVTNALINAKKAVDKSAGGEVENVPVVSTSVAYGVYMAISSNLRYQILAGVIEQRILEPLLHQHKLFLSAVCFAVRTGNTFLGSLLWVDYARWIGVQKAHEVEAEA